MFFARVVFGLDKHQNFRNLSNSRSNIFTYGDSVCTARIEDRSNRTDIIMEYGGFPTYAAASEAGTQLVRNIKMKMIEDEIPVNISGDLGILDSTDSVSITGRLTDYGKALLRSRALFGEKIPDDVAIKDEYIGLQVFEVKESIREIRFVAQEVEVIYNTDFLIDYHPFRDWNFEMDIALSLLTASISINDIRITFLLRLMAIEALVPNSQPQDAKLIVAVDSLLPKVDELDLCREQKEFLKSKIGALKEKNIAQKARNLLQTHLPGKEYNGVSTSKFFNQCYKMRGSFLHSGFLGKGNIDQICRELKRMDMDLLKAISESE